MGWLFRSPKPRHVAILNQQLKDLSRAFPVWIDDDYKFIIVGGVKLPPEYNISETELLIELPADYPFSPPGVAGSHMYVSPALRFGGRELEDMHLSTTPPFQTPRFGPWAWWCYERIRWDAVRDNLIKFIEMVRADLTNPPTK